MLPLSSVIMGHMTVLLLTLSLMTCSNVAEALECYACRDCQLDFMDDRTGIVTEICPRNPQDREDNLARCSKHVEKDGKINRGCSTVKECTLHELISKCSDDTTGNYVIETSCEICCEGNKCNSATMETASPILSLLLGLVLALYRA